jgi:nucleotide-binding universal stress UspA family protein
MNWRKICCPVDFSWESRLALRGAAELVHRVGGELTLLHVDDRMRPPRTDETLAAPAETSDVDPCTVELDRTLASWRDDAERITRTAVDYALVAGAPALEIARFAREGGFDAIVMGTHGQGGRERWPLGSVAQAVARDASCTVIIVRGDRREGSRISPAWGEA